MRPREGLRAKHQTRPEKNRGDEKKLRQCSLYPPIKILWSTPTDQKPLSQKHTRYEEKSKKKCFKKNRQTYPVKAGDKETVGKKNGHGKAADKKKKLYWSKNNLNISPDRCVSFDKLFRSVARHLLVL